MNPELDPNSFLQFNVIKSQFSKLFSIFIYTFKFFKIRLFLHKIQIVGMNYSELFFTFSFYHIRYFPANLCLRINIRDIELSEYDLNTPDHFFLINDYFHEYNTSTWLDASV